MGAYFVGAAGRVAGEVHFQSRLLRYEQMTLALVVDLSRNCAAPLTAYYAVKENIYGTETNGRI